MYFSNIFWIKYFTLPAYEKLVVGVQTVNVNVLVVVNVVFVAVAVEVYQYQRKNLGSTLSSPACLPDAVLAFAIWKKHWILIICKINNHKSCIFKNSNIGRTI